MAIYETANKLANEIKNSKEYIQFKKYMREIITIKLVIKVS